MKNERPLDQPRCSAAKSGYGSFTSILLKIPPKLRLKSLTEQLPEANKLANLRTQDVASPSMTVMMCVNYWKNHTGLFTK